LLHLMAVDAKAANLVAEEGAENLFFDLNRRAVAVQMLDFIAKGRDLEEILHSATLTEEQRAVLSGILLKDENAFAEDTLEKAFSDCRQSVARNRLRQRSRELPELIRQAAQSGDQAKLTAYFQEQLEINRQLKR
jgi:DNA primase